MTGDDRFVGAITAVHDDEPTRLRDDPFAAIFPTRLYASGPASSAGLRPRWAR